MTLHTVRIKLDLLDCWLLSLLSAAEKDTKILLIAELTLESSCIPPKFHHSSPDRVRGFGSREPIPRGQALLMWVFRYLRSCSCHILWFYQLLNVGMGNRPHAEFWSGSWGSTSRTDTASSQNEPPHDPTAALPTGPPQYTMMGISVFLRCHPESSLPGSLVPAWLWTEALSTGLVISAE